MLDKDYDGRIRRDFTGPIFLPLWWGHYDPVYHPSAGAAPMAPTPSMGTGTAPGFSSGRTSLPGASFAASMVTGVQNFSGQVVGNVSAFTSSVTNRTNPVPVSTSSGGYHGGGGHCACACAGCACACAGGGR
jgi:hypothetical protein